MFWNKGSSRVFCLAISVCFLLPVLPTAATMTEQKVNAEEKVCSKLRVAGFKSMYPVTYFNLDTRKGDGIGYELAQQLGAQLGIPVEIRADLPPARMIDMASKGELDMIAGMVETPIRDRFIAFSKPFFRDTLFAYTHKETKMQINTVEDLLNYTRVEVRGDSIGPDLDALFSPKTVWVNNEAQLVSLVMLQRADYFLTTQFDVKLMRINYPKMQDIRKIAVPVKILFAMLGISKISPCVKHLPFFDQYITKHFSE
jgi:polar amino acid transport system substrate-binding protein